MHPSLVAACFHVLLLACAANLPHVASASTTAPATGACKCFPGDTCWPSDAEWSAFNETVGGRLIKTVPLGSPCHAPHHNATECAILQSEWLFSPVHYNSSSSVQAPIFANASCDPFTPENSPCRFGNYVRYAVNASSASDISATLRFASQKNIRLVVRNTAHDYLGRSTGAGALAVWTHHLKDTEVLHWDDESYTGPALKLGAGIQGFEALAAAHAEGLVVVTGECPTVGIAGGYTQGGGHSALSTNFGLSADNTLAFEVVLADGTLVSATATENSDLFWALSGGGPGNYGVVYSMTVRAHPDTIVSGASFTISAPDDDAYAAAVDLFHAALPGILDAEIMIIYFFGTGFLQVSTMTAYNMTSDVAAAALAPFFSTLPSINASVSVNYTEFGSYFDHYNHYFGPLPAGTIQVGVQLFGGRLIPRAVLPSFNATARALSDMGVTFIGVGLDVSRFSDRSNAVLPQWRDSAVSASLTLPYSFMVPFADMVAEQDSITSQVQPLVEAATPHAGAYMNEADFQQPNWQETFFGVNYGALLRIKKKYDPEGLFYATVAVGSEARTIEEDGRMCAVINEAESLEK
ncbi:FAD-binding protein [Mycena sanguinolenta]|uniref:FAD-binding protein n=1 Tax=Mycena sanguinolenta TaxID=230812 RepID=A0A8H6ZIV0_9AGAR|nr:FAD-binding protein [Mycena sanguinolenta]